MRYDQLRHQPNAWTCGPAALRNAFLAHGTRVDVRRVIKASGITREDSMKEIFDTVPGLTAAAQHFGFRFIQKTLHTPEELFAVLPSATPALLCVNHYDHWVTALETSPKFVTICDPARGGELVKKWSWRKLAEWLIWGLPGEERLDIYPVEEAP